MEPTGATHEVGVDELFFSTTDSKGIIEKSNSVFTRLSRYSHEQLMGAPHNIIRHPLMPGGAFYAMWSTLEAGKPFAAYVHNLAADGSRYDVFATITPMRNGGYLSVRARPMVQELFAAADGIYAEAFDTELRERNKGANRHEAAVIGAGLIGQLLAEAGFASYDEFMFVALPAEVAAREAASAGLPRRDDAWGEEANMLRTVQFIFGELDAWMHRMNELADLSQKLQETSNALTHQASTDPIPPALAFTLEHPDLAIVKQTVDVWRQMQIMINGYLSQLASSLKNLRTAVAQNRFQIALSRLHTTMLATFLAEVIDGGAETHGKNQEEIELLREALEDGVQQMTTSQQELHDLLEKAVTALDSAIRMLAIPQQMTPIVQAQAPLLPENARVLIPTIVETIEGVGSTMNDMLALADSCKQHTEADTGHLIELVGYLTEN